MSDKADDVREATRAANEALADLKSTMKGLNAILDRMVEVRADLLEVSENVFADRMDISVSNGLSAFQQVIERQIDNATEAVYERFDTTARILLGKGTEADIEQVAATLQQDGKTPIIQRDPKPDFSPSTTHFKKD